MRLMVEAVVDYAIFMLDVDGHIRSWNTGAQRLKGYTADEVVGQHFSIFYAEEDRQSGHPDDELRQAKRDGRYEEEGWRIRKDGTQFWANVVITALFDEHGQHIGFTKVTRDFTERRFAEERLRQSEERLRLLVESVKDYAIYMLDADGVITTWNAGAQRIKGYTAAEVIGRHFSIFYPPEAIAAGHPRHELEIATKEGRYEEEGWRVRKDGTRLWVNVVISAVYDPSQTIIGFAKVTRDLTDWRRIEQHALQAEIEAVNERARASEAQRMVQVRDEFISVAGHELRTPLTALQLKLQGLEQAVTKSGAGKIAERVQGALRQVDRLNGLVERLLDVSRIVAGSLAMKLEDADFTALVRQVVEDLREPALQGGCELRLHAHDKIIARCDKTRMEQVVVNLVSNAIKYGERKPIDIRLETTDSSVLLVVTDHGIGIALEDIDRIFGRFERAVPVRHYGGLGLGLYVTRNIVEAHGGTIKVTSRAGQGSTFMIEVPRR